jgi:hypothetical protein
LPVIDWAPVPVVAMLKLLTIRFVPANTPPAVPCAAVEVQPEHCPLSEIPGPGLMNWVNVPLPFPLEV